MLLFFVEVIQWKFANAIFLLNYVIGTLTEFVNGTCPESCNAEPTDQPPMRTDVRECVNASFGGDCLGATLNRSVPCNEFVGCTGK